MSVIIGIDVGGSTTKIVGFRVNGEKREFIAPQFVRANDPVTATYGAFGKFTDENRISIKEKHSHVVKMRKYTQYSPDSKYRVLDDHINSYFSRAILFVEGETELELFANPYLQLLFPQIKKYDIYQAMSQSPILNIMHPNKAHSEIPYICLIDADKAIDFDTSTYKLILKNEFFVETKEKFLFRNKKESEIYLPHLRTRIEKMADKLHIHCFKPLYSSRDQNLIEFKSSIHKYLGRYNIFVFDTNISEVFL